MGRPKKVLDNSKVRKRKPVNSIDGVFDILPAEEKYWGYVINKFLKVLEPFSFNKIDVPVIEKSELYTKGGGFKDSFINNNVFTFKRGKKETLALRYDLLMGMARAYVENKLYSQGTPMKLLSYGAIFRNSNNKKDIVKQLYQFNISIIGKGDPSMDAQVIFIVRKMLESIGLKNLEVQINSVGCELCVDEYKKILTDYIKSNKNKLCVECRKNVKESLSSAFDCQNSNCQSVLEDAPEVIDSLCEECNKHFKGILEYLDDLKIPYNLNSRIFKRLGYYTRTSFEILYNEKRESDGGIILAEGGRHDNLIRNLGGNDMPVMGSNLYLDNIAHVLTKKEARIGEKKSKCDVLLIQLGELAKRKSLEIFDEIISKGISVKESLHKDSIKSQLRLADNLGVKIAVIIGQKEVLDGTVLIRDMQSGIQEIIKAEKLVEELKKRLKNFKNS